MQEETEIESPNARLLVSGCNNIIVLAYSIFVTCPELIEIERDSYKVRSMIHNTFSPSKMVFFR